MSAVSVEARPVAPAPTRVGDYLRRARDERGVPLEDVAQKTKIKVEFLRLLEQSRVGELPAEVFVGGFARAYASAVGASPAEATRLLQAEYAARRAPVAPTVIAGEAAQSASAEHADGRRRFGVVLVVVVILIAATLTLSLLLRRPSPADGGMSLLPAASESARTI